MNGDLTYIKEFLISTLKGYVPPLRIEAETETNFKLSGTKPAMQGKQKVDGFYYGSVVPKPKDIRLYFFPIYTHADAFKDISVPLRKCLKGKSCFHIKKLDKELEEDIVAMIRKGVDLYLADGLI
jgi:hypothetical protein